MNPAQELEDRKRIKEVISRANDRYYCRLNNNKNAKRWCISYYYYINDDHITPEHYTIINNINNSVANTLIAMNLHIKSYSIKASVWNKRTNYSERVKDICYDVEA